MLPSDNSTVMDSRRAQFRTKDKRRKTVDNGLALANQRIEPSDKTAAARDSATTDKFVRSRSLSVGDFDKAERDSSDNIADQQPVPYADMTHTPRRYRKQGKTAEYQRYPTSTQIETQL